MYNNDINTLNENLSHMSLCNNSCKMPPEIPPKPKKSYELSRDHLIGQYVMKPKHRLPVDSYYAVNAPAPGIIGVASARLNRGYSEGQDVKLSQPSLSAPAKQQPPPPPQHYYANSPIPPTSVHSQPEYVNEVPLYQNENPHSIIGERYPPNMPVDSKHVYSNYPQHKSTSHYTSFGADEEFPPPPDQAVLCHSPPSPVSSSYSELHHHVSPNLSSAVHHQSAMMPPSGSGKYVAYAPQSLTSSAYESLYEPITPRPDSQMSEASTGRRYDTSRSMHGPYTSPYAKGLAPTPTAQPILNPDKIGKEAEVDALTNLLVQSMDSSNDPEFFGMCAGCGERVVGEGSGCTAMEQVFHIQCFCCAVCLLKLQGKPFYALEAKPYCEDCYLNTLEKCCVCTKPILDRILRATGKPYHPGCFTCVICHKSLDGIPFTVDASNQIHCIEDFHKKFAPRCSVCGEPIMPEIGQDETVRVVALDRSFHVGCYKCEDCGLVLSSEAEGRGCYPLDGHVLCKSCNASRVQALTSKVTTEL